MAEEIKADGGEPDEILGEQIRWENGITVRTYELNGAERTYIFPMTIVPNEEDFLDFWGGVDQSGDGPDRYGPSLSGFVKESFALGITGLYVGDNAITIFLNSSGGRPERRWEELEPAIKSLMERCLLA